jgi:hypothetical protein
LYIGIFNIDSLIFSRTREAVLVAAALLLKGFFQNITFPRLKHIGKLNLPHSKLK